MDSGVAAIVSGAITGAVASIGTFCAYRQMKIQVRSNAQLAVREPRRQTYGDFLTACREAVAAIWDLMDDETRKIDPGPLSDVLGDHLTTLQRHLADVDLEGPQAVAETAHAVIDAFDKLFREALSAHMSGLVDDDDGRPMSYSGNVTYEIKEELDKLVSVAQKALTTHADVRGNITHQ